MSGLSADNTASAGNASSMNQIDLHVESLARALALRDMETEEHSRRVATLTLDLARLYGIPEDEWDNMRRGALLHDIGKIGISDSILLKRGPLTEDELVIIHRHPEYGYELLKPVPYFCPVLDIPYCHHEKWDGTGYPRGLKGKQIPLAARVCAVVDVWDALLTDRPYRPGWKQGDVEQYIYDQAGKHFDPDVSRVFLEAVSKPVSISYSPVLINAAFFTGSE